MANFKRISCTCYGRSILVNLIKSESWNKAAPKSQLINNKITLQLVKHQEEGKEKMRILFLFFLLLNTNDGRMSYSSEKELEEIGKKLRELQAANREREDEVASKIELSVKFLQREAQKMIQALAENVRKNGKLGASIATVLRHVDKLNTKLKHLPTLLAKNVNGGKIRAIRRKSGRRSLGTKLHSTVDLVYSTRHSDLDSHHMMPEIKETKAPRYDQMNQVIGEYIDPDYEANGDKAATIATVSRSFGEEGQGKGR